MTPRPDPMESRTPVCRGRSHIQISPSRTRLAARPLFFFVNIISQQTMTSLNVFVASSFLPNPVPDSSGLETVSAPCNLVGAPLTPNNLHAGCARGSFAGRLIEIEGGFLPPSLSPGRSSARIPCSASGFFFLALLQTTAGIHLISSANDDRRWRDSIAPLYKSSKMCPECTRVKCDTYEAIVYRRLTRPNGPTISRR